MVLLNTLTGQKSGTKAMLKDCRKQFDVFWVSIFKRLCDSVSSVHFAASLLFHALKTRVLTFHRPALSVVIYACVTCEQSGCKHYYSRLVAFTTHFA